MYVGISSSLHSLVSTLSKLIYFTMHVILCFNPSHNYVHVHACYMLQIRRHKISASSMGLTNFNTEISSVNPKDRLPTPPFPKTSPSTPSRTSASSQRRKSIAVMEPGQRHPTTAQECLQINVKDPELAMIERQRKQSWSIVVGDADSRSVDTGLNELDRVTGKGKSIWLHFELITLFYQTICVGTEFKRYLHGVHVGDRDQALVKFKSGTHGLN